MNLFPHRELMTWRDKPFVTPPDLPVSLQAILIIA